MSDYTQDPARARDQFQHPGRLYKPSKFEHQTLTEANFEGLKKFMADMINPVAGREYISVRTYTPSLDNPPTDPRPTYEHCITCDHPILHTAYAIDGDY